MSNTVLLNNVDHANLRIVTDRGAQYGDDVMFSVTFPSEFRNLQAHYPLVFHKSADGHTIQPVALFGFQQGENLFLAPTGWDAACVPMAIERQPFLIGRTNRELVMHVDLDSPRVGATSGEAVFLPHGGTTTYLERMNSMLLALHEGLETNAPFIAALLKHDLLESFVFDIELADGSQNRLAGFYTINEECLNNLGGDALASLNKAGYLQPIYMAVASVSKLLALVERKNRLHAASL